LNQAASLPGRRDSGVTRQSINFLRTKIELAMDARVKPAHDAPIQSQ
jgi:hypothetical protein